MTVIAPPSPATAGAETPPPVDAGPPAPPPNQAHRLRRLAIGAGVVVGGFVAWEILTRYVAYTDDAYVRSDLVAVAPQVTGHIIQVAVRDNQAVHRGDLLVRIDPVPFQLTVQARQATLRETTREAAADQDAIVAAQADLDAANATLDDARASETRVSALVRDDAVSRQEHDNAEAALNRAVAAVAAAKAAVQRAEALSDAQQNAIAQAEADLAIAQWQLDRTSIPAPVDGTINNLDLQVGDTARADTPLVGIVAADAWRIIANYKQDYLRFLRPGQTAWVWLDSHPWHFYRARIAGVGRGISRGAGDSGILPYVAPTTDWIRLQRRFPVTIDLVDPPPDLTLYMGADARTLVFP